MVLAERQQALVISLEHRFYGESIPGNVSLSTSNLRLLTAKQALADLSSTCIDARCLNGCCGLKRHRVFVVLVSCSEFISWYQFQIDHNEEVGGKPLLPGRSHGNKWVVIGGSYPGVCVCVCDTFMFVVE